LESKDTLTLSAVKPALTRLLPDLKPDEANQLDSRQRQCLYRMLEPTNADGEDAPLLAAILIALGKMEDEAAIPYVERLAQATVHTQRGEQIQEQARQSLALLQQCAERRQMSQTLLRAAQPSEPSGDILLRPASGVPTTDPDQLLRASLSAEDP
jgi:hypothetical protein